MNERIHEIVRQTGYTWHVTGNPEMVAYYEFAPEKLEEFAELIVRECAAIALREDHEPSECILTHFGVKR